MKATIVLLLLLIAGLVVYVVTSGGRDAPPVPAAGSTDPPVLQKKEWKPDEIAKDPQGYLAWSDAQIQMQIAEREKRLKTLAERREDVQKRSDAFLTSLSDVQNIRMRLKRAYRQAEDEDRWPIRMAGRTFDRAKARQILDQTQKWLDDRKPLGNAYHAATKEMDDSAAQIRGDIADLHQMRDKVALDLEKVRLNQGLAELGELNKSSDQLAAMSAALSRMSEEEAVALPAPKAERVDIDSLLK